MEGKYVRILRGRFALRGDASRLGLRLYLLARMSPRLKGNWETERIKSPPHVLPPHCSDDVTGHKPPPLCGVRTVKASVIRMNVLSHCLRQFIESNEDVTRTKINQNGRIILTVCDMAQNITLYVISILHYVTEILITSVTWAMQCRPLPTLPSHTVCNSAPTIEFLYVDGATTSVDGCANERPFDSATPSNDNTSPPMDIETYLTYLNVLFSFATAHTWL